MAETFSGKVVVVTGASSGIGAETARVFASLGASLTITGRNENNLKKVALDCGLGKVLTVIGDVSIEEDAERIIRETVDKFGRLDVLVNNAGTYENGGIKNTTLAQYDRIMATNTRAVYHLTMLAVPHLIKTKGNIVNVSSVVGTRSFPNVLSYSISKSALDQLTKCTALELAADGVRVNSVNPGVIVTPLFGRAMDDEAVKGYLEASKGSHPLGRVGQPNEVANAIIFLASDKAAFITGAALPIDGGRHLTCLRPNINHIGRYGESYLSNTSFIAIIEADIFDNSSGPVEDRFVRNSFLRKPSQTNGSHTIKPFLIKKTIRKPYELIVRMLGLRDF